jgi:hypothetical protein
MKMKMIVQKKNRFSFMHLHKWNVRKQTGANVYSECRCGARKVHSNAEGYQPVDFDWLNKLKNI